MSIRELNDQFEIQGAFHIKLWDDTENTAITLARGDDFEIDRWEIDDETMERKITYMYAVNGELNIEVE